MLKRPHLGRAGAGALIAIATLALGQAVAAGTSEPLPLPATSLASLHAPLPTSGRFAQRLPDSPPEAENVAVIPAGRPAIRVPILMYHYIRINPNPGDRLGAAVSVTPADFRLQLDWLAANGYHTVDLEQLRGYLLGHGELPARPVVLTFDDGYRDLYTTAYPILREHDDRAVAYIVSGYLGAPNNVTREQVLEMSQNGIEIASHTVSHADLTTLGAGELARQLVDSRADLERLVGHPVVDFCYPAGRVNETAVRAVAAAGYQTATTTQPGVGHGAGDRLLWTRVRVAGGESVESLARDLGPEEAAVVVTRPSAHPVLRVPSLPVILPLLAPRPGPGPELLGPGLGP